MKFTIELSTLVKMLTLVSKKAPTQKRRDKLVRLSACAARVFVEANDSTGGVEALVLEDGTCLLSHDIFLKILKTYAAKPNITIEADNRSVRFFSTTLPSEGYSHSVKPPGRFQVFPVRDTWVAGASEPPASK